MTEGVSIGVRHEAMGGVGSGADASGTGTVRLPGGRSPAAMGGSRTDGGDPASPGRGRSIGIAALAALVSINLVNAVALSGPFRWWANFILLPGAALVVLAIALGRWRVARFVVGWLGAVVIVTGLLLLFGGMGGGWPLMIAVPAVGPAGLLALRLKDQSLAAAARTVGMLALVAIALGTTFIAFHLDLLDPGKSRWWVTYMFAAGAVPLANGLALLSGRRGSYWFSVGVLLLALGAGTVLAAVRQLQGWIM